MASQFYGRALLVIESNTLETRDPDRDVDGDQSGFILNRLREVYPNLYARRQSEEAVRMGAPVRYGFHTNISTKPAIVATPIKVIREGCTRSGTRTVSTNISLTNGAPNGSYGAIAGCHDDLLMTRAIGLPHICFHEDPPRRTPARRIRFPYLRNAPPRPRRTVVNRRKAKPRCRNIGGLCVYDSEDQQAAITSISTQGLPGKLLHGECAACGKGSQKNSAYTSFMGPKRLMSARKTVDFTTFSIEVPAASRMAFTLERL